MIGWVGIVCCVVAAFALAPPRSAAGELRGWLRRLIRRVVSGVGDDQ